MAYQETVTTGYGTRVKQSFKKIATGFTLFLSATALLWWNEGNSVKTADMLDEAQSVCEVMENPNKKDASLEGQLISEDCAIPVKHYRMGRGRDLQCLRFRMVSDSHRYRLAVLSSHLGHYVVGHCRFPHLALCLRW